MLNSSTKTVSYALATADQFDDIHHLNYRAFVEEIPQHPPNVQRKLIDKFHDQNTYVIARCKGETIGMVTLRGQRPFSLDSKLVNLDSYLPQARAICELRLLYVVPEHRRSVVFYGLAHALFTAATEKGYDLAIVSATLREMRLYKHLGFVAFGPEVGTEAARFQPMWLDFSGLKNAVPHLVNIKDDSANFSTGPVTISATARAAFAAPPVSHRSAQFLALLTRTRKALCDVTGAKEVAVLCGSGTTANDMIALQIAARFGATSRGLILANGEFGERLCAHAARAGLCADVLRKPWGETLEFDDVAQHCDGAKYAWIWCVHCETSTGALIDLPALKQYCAQQNIALYLDCMSTVGVVEIDLHGVELASASSGKGLTGIAGLAMVFANGVWLDTPHAPTSLNLAAYLQTPGTPHTMSSPLLAALDASVQAINAERFSQINLAMCWLRAAISREATAFGLHIITPLNAHAAVLTLALPAQYSATSVGLQLQKSGVVVGFESSYLSERNWLQIALMGTATDDFSDLRRLVYELRHAVQHGMEHDVNPSIAPSSFGAQFMNQTRATSSSND